MCATGRQACAKCEVRSAECEGAICGENFQMGGCVVAKVPGQKQTPSPPIGFAPCLSLQVALELGFTEATPFDVCCMMLWNAQSDVRSNAKQGAGCRRGVPERAVALRCVCCRVHAFHLAYCNPLALPHARPYARPHVPLSAPGTLHSPATHCTPAPDYCATHSRKNNRKNP